MDATDKGPSCVQGLPAWLIPDFAIAPGEEDCLLLNVLAPASANSSSNLAVMVQIHGGGKFRFIESERAPPSCSLRDILV